MKYLVLLILLGCGGTIRNGKVLSNWNMGRFNIWTQKRTILFNYSRVVSGTSTYKVKTIRNHEVGSKIAFICEWGNDYCNEIPEGVE